MKKKLLIEVEIILIACLAKEPFKKTTNLNFLKAMQSFFFVLLKRL